MKKSFVALAILFSGLSVNAQSPQESCRQSLNTAYQEVPGSMYALCGRANIYSAQAVDKFTKKYTESLGSRMLAVLMTVNTPRQLRCVGYIADNYSEVSAYFVTRVCLNSIELNY